MQRRGFSTAAWAAAVPTAASLALLAAVLHAIDEFTIRELLIALFLFITAPVSAYLLGQVGLRKRVASRAPLPEDFPGVRQ